MTFILAFTSQRGLDSVSLGIIVFFAVAIPFAGAIMISSRLGVTPPSESSPATSLMPVLRLRRPLAPKAEAEHQLEQGWQLAFEDQEFANAKAVLSAIFANVLPANRQHLLASALAWCDVHLDESDHAVTLADEGVENARKHSDQNLTDCLAVLGATCVVAGKAAKGVAILEPLTKSHQRFELLHPAFVSVFLGDGLAALDRPQDARAAWQHAAGTSADNRYASLARERLAAAAVATPYR